MKRWIARCAAAFIGCQTAIAAEAVIGRATVIDGDTIEILDKRIRLHGIDAPEARQKCKDKSGLDYPCGRYAAMALDWFLKASRPTRCEIVDRDRYQRLVGVCFRADGNEINLWMVGNGEAVDWTRYSGGSYAAAQDVARRYKLGLWQGEFQKPCDARAQRAKQASAC